MSQVIWKYELLIADVQEVEIPYGSTILSAQEQNNKICLWVLVVSDNPTETRIFEIYGTGEVVPEDHYLGKFVGTVQVKSYVWHIFDSTEEKEKEE